LIKGILPVFLQVFGQYFEHLGVNDAIGGAALFFKGGESVSREIGNLASGFFEYKGAGSGVPGAEFEFPEAVESSASGIA